MTDFIQEFRTIVNKYSDIPKIFTEAGGLSIISTCLGRFYYIPNARGIRPNLFIIFSSAPHITRRSYIIRCIQKVKHSAFNKYILLLNKETKLSDSSRERYNNEIKAHILESGSPEGLIDDIESWDILLVIKMDRIHRNSKNFMLMMEELKKKNKEFVSMTESLDTSTAMGRFVMDIIQRIAQLESEQIGERVYDGMAQKARINGGALGFNIPYGYDYIDKQLVVNKKEANVVTTIFDLYLDGSSMKKIADFLNEKNIPTKKKKTWGSQTVSKILKNPLYCGTFHWGEFEHQKVYPSIINDKIFNKCQYLIKNK